MALQFDIKLWRLVGLGLLVLITHLHVLHILHIHVAHVLVVLHVRVRISGTGSRAGRCRNRGV